MWEEILRLAVGNGLWAVLFCFLLIYQLKDSRAREGKYQQTIASLCDRLNVLFEVKQTAEETLKAVKVKKEKTVQDGAEKSKQTQKLHAPVAELSVKESA